MAKAMGVVINGKSRIGLKAQYKDKDKCKSIVGAKWSKPRKLWIYPWSVYSIRRILKAFLEIEASDAVQKLYDLYRQKREANKRKYQGVKDDRLPKDLWPHQADCLVWLLNSGEGGYLIAPEMGGGKTRIAIEFIRIKNLKKVLIVAPKSVLLAWERQFNKYYPKMKVIALTQSSVAQKLKALKIQWDAVQALGDPAAVLVNYESSWRKPLSDALEVTDWDLIVMDECHRIKSPTSKQSKFASKLNAPYRFGLSGTPLTKDCLDAFGIFQFLDKGAFGTSFYNFRNRYCIYDQMFHKPLQYINQEEFNNIFHFYTYRITTEEALPWLPETRHIEIPLGMDKKTKKVYQAMRNRLIAEYKDNLLTAANGAVKLLRLQQITSGIFPDDDGEVHEINTIKADALKELLEGISYKEPVVVFVRFRHDIEKVKKVAKECGRECLEQSGSKHEWGEWQYKRKGGEVLVTQIGAGGEGVELTRTRYCVFYSLGFSYYQYDQALARTHRPGQDREVAYYHLIVANSVDEQVYKSLSKKEDAVKAILDSFKEGIS